MFLSSELRTGMLGGLEGADGLCTELAANAGLEGEFKAWLSSAQLGPAQRMTHSAGPYRLATGTLVANNWDDLTDGSLAHPINLDEQGQPLLNVPFVCEGNEVWTNTKPDGNPAGFMDCAGWLGGNGTSNTGLSSASNGSWTQSGCVSVTCATALPIYCVQQ